MQFGFNHFLQHCVSPFNYEQLQRIDNNRTGYKAKGFSFLFAALLRQFNHY
tara:strand:- start:3701 stop:3853 length:153 start_codon:yes stop_codon:yes gene_type:complete